MPLKIISIGRLIERKGFHIVCAAITQTTSNIEYGIIGSGPYMEELLKYEKIDNRIKLYGELSDENKERLLDKSSLFIMTPLKLVNDIEGFGIVYAEATSHGCAIVTSPYCGFAELVTHKFNGLVCEPEVASIIEIIEFSYNNFEILKTYCQRMKVQIQSLRPQVVAQNIDIDLKNLSNKKLYP